MAIFALAERLPTSDALIQITSKNTRYKSERAFGASLRESLPAPLSLGCQSRFTDCRPHKDFQLWTQTHKLRPTYSTFWQARTQGGAHHPDEHKAYYCVIHGRCHQRPGPAQPPPRLPSTHIHLPRHQVQCHPLPPSSMSLSYSLGLMSPSLIHLQVIQLPLSS